MLFMYLCEVAIVSQLCISFPYVLHGLCEDYLTCDIAFNAVMPLSRASTCGRYSRIEGLTTRFRGLRYKCDQGLVKTSKPRPVAEEKLMDRRNKILLDNLPSLLE